MTTAFFGKFACDDGLGVSSLCYVTGRVDDCTDQVSVLNTLMARDDCKSHYGFNGNPFVCTAKGDNMFGFGSSVASSSADAQADCIIAANALEGMVTEITKSLPGVGFPGQTFNADCFLNTIYVKEENQTLAAAFAETWTPQR